MHFRSLLTVYLPAVEPDSEWEKEVADQVKQMRESQPENIGSIGQKVMLDIFYEGMNNISTTVGREVTPGIRDVMERFNCGTEDNSFLEFDYRTGEALRDYNEIIDCMRLPDGRIVEEYPAPQWHKFIIKDGKVYVKDSTCRDHICEKMGPISNNGEMIICIPNSLFITIVSDKEGEYDAVS